MTIRAAMQASLQARSTMVSGSLRADALAGARPGWGGVSEAGFGCPESTIGIVIRDLGARMAAKTSANQPKTQMAATSLSVTVRASKRHEAIRHQGQRIIAQERYGFLPAPR